MDVTENNPDVLQNIEFVIVKTYQECPDLIDHNVDKVIEGLIRLYQAEWKGRPSPTLRLTELEQRLHVGIKQMCDWRLGREKLSTTDATAITLPADSLSPEIIIACLKRIRRSISLWTKELGRQGYLNYVQQFIP